MQQTQHIIKLCSFLRTLYLALSWFFLFVSWDEETRHRLILFLTSLYVQQTPAKDTLQFHVIHSILPISLYTCVIPPTLNRSALVSCRQRSEAMEESQLEMSSIEGLGQRIQGIICYSSSILFQNRQAAFKRFRRTRSRN